MTFQDIFKSNFLENVNAVSPVDMVLTVLLSFGIGLYILFVYKRTYQGVLYSSSFGVTLLALTMITSQIILAVTSNVVLSLGMVGALSIVRFRTAIKEPLDIAFLFWSIAAGIILAAGMLPLAVFGSIITGLILLVFVNRKPHRTPYILVLSCRDRAAKAEAMCRLREQVERCAVKSESVREGLTELNVEVRLKDGETDFLHDLTALNGVNSAMLVSYNGEYMG